MLNQQKLEAFCLQQQLTGPAYQIIERIRKLPPSRRVNSRHNNVSCRFPSRKMGCVIQAESHGNELATIYLWEHDPRVHEFYDQPEPIKLSYVRGTRTISYQHTPDFFLIADHFVGWIECKLEEDLERLAKQHPERFQRLGDTWISPPGRTFAEQFGLDYAIRSSQENDWSLIKNLHFLQDYIDPSCPPVSEAQHAAAKTLFAKQSCYLLFDLLRANATLPPDAIYKMLVDGDLIADLSSGLLSNSTSFMVYADALAFDIFRQQRATASPLLGAQALSFDPGASLIWNGAAWRVGSCHQNHVDLISSKGEVQSLAWSSIEELLTRNELAAPTSTSHQKTQAWLSRKLMASSSLMLQQAWQRQQMAKSQPSPASKQRHASGLDWSSDSDSTASYRRSAYLGASSRSTTSPSSQLDHISKLTIHEQGASNSPTPSTSDISPEVIDVSMGSSRTIYDKSTLLTTSGLSDCSALAILSNKREGIYHSRTLMHLLGSALEFGLLRENASEIINELKDEIKAGDKIILVGGLNSQSDVSIETTLDQRTGDVKPLINLCKIKDVELSLGGSGSVTIYPDGTFKLGHETKYERGVLTKKEKNAILDSIYGE
ncbi:hypothetical protein [Chromobacterium haemolyticum]|uniref:hypothetical protein n=1 Tax=Chromobacterium haemolyticum TaxID=394935 RepID=UPI002448C875|nr:hypothetical protein [Chromobacterium haemolyticum]MDH0344415.1 hypothetical protein [Chromobacterium haemolyticum]